MANLHSDIIGKGMVFPITLTRNSEGKSGWYPVDGSIDLIYNNLSALLWYDIGQRIRQEDFGSRLMECIEEPNTQALAFLVKNFIKQAFSKFESRISFLSSTVTRNQSKVHIELQYKIIQTGVVQTTIATYDLSTNQLNT